MVQQLFLPFTEYKYLLSQLITREIKARYKQSIIGYAWILLNPLAQLLVYSFVFSLVVRFPTDNIPYPLFLFVGLLPWTFTQTSLANATQSLVENASLIRKVQFPREVIPYAVVAAKSVDLAFASSLLVIFMLAYGRLPGWSVFALIPLFMLQGILTTGLALLFSTFNLFYRDVQYLVNLFLLLWLYLTPVVYPFHLVPKQYQGFLLLNPLVGIIEGYRAALFGGPILQPALWSSIAISFFLLFLGWFLFKKGEKIFADVV